MFWLILLIVVAALCALVLFLVAPAAGRKELRTPFAGRNFAHRGYFGKDQRPPENSLPAFAAAVQNGYGIDLVILDIMMPFMDGMTCLREMRTRKIMTPVIMLTARSEEYDKLAGLEGGADDYVVKPFSPRELVARVKAVLARTMPAPVAEGNVYTFGNLVIDTASHSVKVAGQEAPLTPKEFDLLVFLVNNKGIALSREKILQKVWNYDYYGEDRTVDTHVKMLRSHLGSCRGYIVTVWGVGYKFDPDTAQ